MMLWDFGFFIRNFLEFGSSYVRLQIELDLFECQIFVCVIYAYEV